MTVKAYPDRICIYFDNQLIARHTRRYGRHQDIEDPDHAKALIAQRGHAREQRLMLRFLVLSPDAQAYYDGLEQRRLNARNHLRKILALAEIYPPDAVTPGIRPAYGPLGRGPRAPCCGLGARGPRPSGQTHRRGCADARIKSQLTRRHDLLDIDIAPPDLNAYKVNDHDPE